MIAIGKNVCRSERGRALRMGNGGYLKAGQKVDWESESRRPEIFSQPMMMNAQGRDRPCDVTVRRVVPAPCKVGKDESFSLYESCSSK
jgi:hypothetical protein